MKIGKAHGLRVRASSGGALLIVYEWELVLEEADMQLLPAELEKAVTHLNGLLRAYETLKQKAAAQGKQISALQSQLAAGAAPEYEAAGTKFRNTVGGLADDADYLAPAAPDAVRDEPPAPEAAPADAATAGAAPESAGGNKLVLK